MKTAVDNYWLEPGAIDDPKPKKTEHDKNQEQWKPK